MPTTTDPRSIKDKSVPLNIWPADPVANSTGVRCQLAAQLIETYSPPAGTVIDLCPGRGEVLAAATSSGRGAIALRQPPGCAGRPHTPALDAIAAAADLIVALPPASHLRPPRPHPISPAAAKIVARRAAPLLRPGGYLVVGTLGRPGGDGRDPVTCAVAAATDAGLAYYQHLVVLLEVDLDLEPPTAAPEDRRGRLAHADLLVFTRTAQ